MLNLVQKFFHKDGYNRSQLRKKFSDYFFSQPEHAWIAQSSSREHFENLIEILPSGVLNALISKYPISFIPNDRLRDHSQVGHVLTNTVVVFPEFQKLLQTSKKSAVAYIAHELAFVLYELEGGQNDSLMAEVEADKFVCDLGLTFELEEFLLMLDETIEKRLRLTYLTIHHFSKDQ